MHKVRKPRSSIRQHLETFVLEPLQQINNQQQVFLDADRARLIDRDVVVVFVATAFLLTLQNYFVIRGNPSFLLTGLASLVAIDPTDWLQNAGDAAQNRRFVRLLSWSIGNLFIYVVIPIALIRFVMRRKLRDFGISWSRALANWWIYLLMYMAVAIAVVIVSKRESFLNTYPFYRPAPNEPLWPKFVIWEFAYALQFVCLEFFFRGFLLHGVKRRCGIYSIFIMTVPYCMIHFGKPMPETVGAVVAGIVLGFMSLKTNSIWFGALLHIAVAWTMDALAI